MEVADRDRVRIAQSADADFGRGPRADAGMLTVSVMDRGPYVDGRDWDLTGGACLVLDFCYTGIIQWHLGG